MAWYSSLLKGAGAVAGGKVIDKLFPQKTDYSHLQKGIQWRVEDAKKAGIHPLYALGANISSPTVTTGSTGSDLARSVIESDMRKDRKAGGQAIRESNARIKSHEASAARDFALAAKAESDVARAGQNMNTGQDYSAQDDVIDPRPRAVVSSTGTKVYAGKGSPAQRGEDEYGESWEIENFMRYMRDVMGPRYQEFANKWFGSAKGGLSKRRQQMRGVIQRK